MRYFIDNAVGFLIENEVDAIVLVPFLAIVGQFIINLLLQLSVNDLIYLLTWFQLMACCFYRLFLIIFFRPIV
jgi:hypothetical protein